MLKEREITIAVSRLGDFFLDSYASGVCSNTLAMKPFPPALAASNESSHLHVPCTCGLLEGVVE